MIRLRYSNTINVVVHILISKNTKLDIESLEIMTRIHSFYLSQINDELKVYGKKMIYFKLLLMKQYIQLL